MEVIACVIDDVDLRSRLRSLLLKRADTTVIESDTDPLLVRRLLANEHITAAILCPSALHKFLELRKAVHDCGVDEFKPMIIIAAETLDSAFVYRALSFGVDDMIDIARDDDDVVHAIDAALSGKKHAYRTYLVGEVDAQVDIMSLHIVYADEVDRRIVPMIAAGYTDREIADVLHFSHQVVRNRVSRILLLSGIRNRTQLATTFLLDRLAEGA